MLQLIDKAVLSAMERQTLSAAYSAAFPLSERRPEAQLFDERPEGLRLLTLYDGETLVGMLTLWSLSGVLFVEHFLTLEGYRNKGYGQQCLERLKAESDCPLVLECEYPTDDLSTRRLGFYKRLGFVRQERPYYQPPYLAGTEPVPMYLLATEHFVGEALEALVSELYIQVYRHYPQETTV
ncbi:MAG: GNAT family N-acetyltransferase [Porphyromonas sp.]|nr:GNAT family N-acetyltransferase [Porphyromonas sp.]